MIDSTTSFSVSALVGAISGTLRSSFSQIRISGEIGQYTRASSGHWYLTLKDEHAQIKAVMFRQKNVLAGFTPKLGDQVEALAELAVYEARGELQLILHTLKPAGSGSLHEQFQVLKKKLTEEGLFNGEHRKPIPKYVFNVGVVTSPQAAAFADVKRAFARRTPHINYRLYPSSVQGDAAKSQIVNALLQADAAGHDVVLLVRGGGSLEDLWSFNEEAVVRAVFAMHTPIVVGVGHETDVTLAEFAADLRAATPTAAAEQISQSTDELLGYVQYLSERLAVTFQRFAQSSEQRVDRLEAEILTPHERLEALSKRVEVSFDQLGWQMGAVTRRYVERVDALFARFPGFANRSLTNSVNKLAALESSLLASTARVVYLREHRLLALSELLEARSVQGNLEKGYAILQDQSGKVVSKVGQATAGKSILARVADGEIGLVVTEKKSP